MELQLPAVLEANQKYQHGDFHTAPRTPQPKRHLVILTCMDARVDPARIHVIPDCGLRTRSWDVAYGKLESMVAGVELAKKDLGL